MIEEQEAGVAVACIEYALCILRWACEIVGKTVW